MRAADRNFTSGDTGAARARRSLLRRSHSSLVVLRPSIPFECRSKSASVSSNATANLNQKFPISSSVGWSVESAPGTRNSKDLSTSIMARRDREASRRGSGGDGVKTRPNAYRHAPPIMKAGTAATREMESSLAFKI